MKTKAYASPNASEMFQPYSFDRREPGAKDVLIEISHCGICHSDIHTARSEWGQAYYPCVPGHEIVGKVLQTGKDVKKFKVDQNVGVGCLVNSCRTCDACQNHLEQYCENGFTGTYNSPLPDGDYSKGGYSRHIVVDEHFVLDIPSNLDLAAAAPLLCAGITTYSPMKYAGVKKGSKIAVKGLGGLGHMAVKIAASFGAEVTVLSRSDHKKTDAQRLGAAHFINTNDEDAMAQKMKHYDFVLDTVSAKHDLDQTFNMLKRDGTLILVGASHEPLEFSPFSPIFARRKLMGSLIGGLQETQEMLNHCGEHNIVSDIEMIKAEQINEAYERMLRSDVKYRFVIDNSTL